MNSDDITSTELVVPRGGSVEEGDRLGDYIVEAAIDSGGFGTVYRGRHISAGPPVALKVLHAGLAAHGSVLERFQREAKTIGMLRHPNIVQMLDVGVYDGCPYIVMELLEGTTLTGLLAKRGRLSPAEVVDIAEQICAALSVVHEAGIVHRDLKSANIFLGNSEGSPDGKQTVKLLDFGIAKLTMVSLDMPNLTAVGERVGTPSNMSPEQVRTGKLDGRTDIYSLGIVLFQLLTGEVPFRAVTQQELLCMHLDAPPPLPSQFAPVGSALDAVVVKCLAKSPDDRYPNANAVAAALRAAVPSASASANAAPEQSCDGIGISIHVHVAAGFEEDDDALVQAGQTLEQAEQQLKAAGIRVQISTSSVVLGLKLFSAGEQGQAEYLRVLSLAQQMQQDFLRDPETAAKLRLAISLHFDRVRVRAAPEGPEVLGGELLSSERWSHADESDSGVFVTPALAKRINSAEAALANVRILGA